MKNKDYYSKIERQQYNKEYYESHKHLKGKTLKQKAQIIDSQVGKFEDTEWRTLSLINNKKISEATLDYEIKDDKYTVRMINTLKEYKRKGNATKLLSTLQEKVGNDDLYFDLVTEDGKKLLDNVADIEVYKKGAYDVPYYKGKIKNETTRIIEKEVKDNIPLRRYFDDDFINVMALNIKRNYGLDLTEKEIIDKIWEVLRKKYW